MASVSFSRKEIFLILMLASIQFTHIVDFMIVMPLGPQLMRAFDIDTKAFGFLVSVYTFTAGASGLLGALFIDFFDRKKVLLISFIGFSFGTLACAVAESFSALLIARSLTGAFGGILASLSFSIVADNIPPERRGTAMGLLSTSFAMASIAGVPASLYLANQFTWHTPFFALGFLTLMLSVLAFFVIPPMRHHLGLKKLSNVFEEFLSLVKRPSLIWGLVFMFTLMMGQFTIIPLFSASLVMNGGLPEKDLPLIYLTGGLASILAAPLLGRLADMHGKRKIYLISATILVPVVYMSTRMHHETLSYILLAVTLFFICITGRMSSAMAMISSLVAADHRGSFMSLVASVQQFSAALGAFVSGLIVVKSTEGPLLHYGTAGLLSMAFTLTSLYVVFKLKPVEGKF